MDNNKTVKMRVSMTLSYPYAEEDYGHGVSMRKILQNEIDSVRADPIFFLQTIQAIIRADNNVDNKSIDVDNVFIYVYNEENGQFEDDSFLLHDEEFSNDAYEYAGSLEDDWSPLTDPVQLELDL